MSSTLPALPPSPCIKLCQLDADTGWCRGCGRSIEEISAWSGLDRVARAAVFERLGARLAYLADTTGNSI